MKCSHATAGQWKCVGPLAEPVSASVRSLKHKLLATGCGQCTPIRLLPCTRAHVFFITSQREGKRGERKHKKTRTTGTQIFISITLNVKSKTIRNVFWLEFLFGLSNLTAAYRQTRFRMEGGHSCKQLHMNEIITVTKRMLVSVLHIFRRLTSQPHCDTLTAVCGHFKYDTKGFV